MLNLPLPDRPSRKPGLLIVVADAPVISITLSVGSPDTRNVNMTSYKANTTKPIANTTSMIYKNGKKET